MNKLINLTNIEEINTLEMRKCVGGCFRGQEGCTGFWNGYYDGYMGTMGAESNDIWHALGRNIARWSNDVV
ncbi:hypothetical protein L3073_16370 [Ancylomarina sp. DW003]|nr:hypothetical protein [Ancylomarina sp. DW003]MDE5423791.1 hypothetical protein [Ancylomarina sp. DW003]